MHFYWRIIEELKLIGENWTIKDPGLKRNYENWLRFNAEAIALSAMDTHEGNSGILKLGVNSYIQN